MCPLGGRHKFGLGFEYHVERNGMKSCDRKREEDG